MKTSKQFNPETRNKLYFIDRYDNFKRKFIRDHSGYEQIIRHSSSYTKVESHWVLNKLIKPFVKWLKRHKKHYIVSNSSKEIIGFIYLLLRSKSQIHYLYADKDALILPFLKRKLRLKKMVLVGTFHWPVNLEQGHIKHMEELILLQFNKAIVLGPQLIDYYSRFIPEVKFIPHGIDLEFWCPIISETTLERYVTLRNILVIGESNRNHQAQINMMRKMLDYDKNLTFSVLIKSKDLVSSYSEVANTKVLDTYILDNELKDLYENALAVLIIQNNCLGSNVVLEAMAMGVPLIANNVGDIECYLGEDYCLFVDDDISENQQAILNQSELYTSLCNQLKDRSKLFSWEHIAKVTLEFVNN